MAASAGDGEREAATRLLPGELLGAVFARLEVPDRCIASGVCRRWRAEALGEPRSTALQLRIVETKDKAIEAERAKGRKQQPQWLAFVEKQQAAGADIGAAHWPGRKRDDPLAPMPRFTPTLTAAETAAFLRRPICAGLKRLVMRLEPVDPEKEPLSVYFPATPMWQPKWCLAAVAPALPAGLERLELELPDNLAANTVGNSAAGQALSDLALDEHAPLLRELVVRGWQCEFMMLQAEHPNLRLPRVELLGVDVIVLFPGRTVQLMRQHFPSLRRVFSLNSGDGLSSLAAAGVRAARLKLPRADLSSPAAAAAAVSVLQPAAFGPDAGPPGIRLTSCALPDDWPGAFPAGLQSIWVGDCALRPSALNWLFRGPHAASLKRVELHLQCTYGGLRPRDLFAAFEELHAGARLDMAIPKEWTDEKNFVELMETLSGSKRLLRTVRVGFESGAPPPFAESDPRTAAWARYGAAQRAALAGGPDG